MRRHELVILSKNREDCRPTECQIQYLAKLLSVRRATPEELDIQFPNVSAGDRWRYMACLYWSRKLDQPFNLSGVTGLNHRRYDPVQDFARLDPDDEQPFLDHLLESNPKIVMDFLQAEPPDGAG